MPAFQEPRNSIQFTLLNFCICNIFAGTNYYYSEKTNRYTSFFPDGCSRCLLSGCRQHFFHYRLKSSDNDDTTTTIHNDYEQLCGSFRPAETMKETRSATWGHSCFCNSIEGYTEGMTAHQNRMAEIHRQSSVKIPNPQHDGTTNIRTLVISLRNNANWLCCLQRKPQYDPALQHSSASFTLQRSTTCPNGRTHSPSLHNT